jgi:putative ubiquitin-RnfH superfamily antitoxin RatB of RatAB toxin-antitoxin module
MVPPSEQSSAYIVIEVAYALPRCQFLKRFTVPAGTSLAQAIELSGVTSIFSEIDCTVMKTGIYGKIVSAETILQPYDRVEIYRPLTIDPKEKRRLRSAKRIKK